MRRSARGVAEASCMGLLELGAEAFASERAMLRSMLGVEGCAALGEVREAAARRLDQFVMDYCHGPSRSIVRKQM